MFLIYTASRPGVTINPLIVKGIDSLDAPDSVKRVLHEIIEVENSITVGSDRHAPTTAIKRILEECAGNDEVVKFCGKHG